MLAGVGAFGACLTSPCLVTLTGFVRPDAATELLDAALLWHQATGSWDPGGLRNLKQERAIIGQAAFDRLAAAKIPQDLRTSLDAGIQNAENA